MPNTFTLRETIDQILKDEEEWSKSLKDRILGGGDTPSSSKAAVEEARHALNEVRQMVGGGTQSKFRTAAEEANEPDIAERFAQRQQEINQRALERNNEARSLSEKARVVRDWARETKENMGKALDDIGNAVGGD